MRIGDNLASEAVRVADIDAFSEEIEPALEDVIERVHRWIEDEQAHTRDG